MDFSGKVIAVLPAKEGTAKSTGNPWRVQSYVIENHDNYPKKLCFEVYGDDKIKQFNIQMGEELNVSFDVDARQWNDRWFNSIRAWKVDRVDASAATTPAPAAGPMDAPAVPASDAPFTDKSNATDDLPF